MLQLKKFLLPFILFFAFISGVRSQVNSDFTLPQEASLTKTSYKLPSSDIYEEVLGCPNSGVQHDDKEFRIFCANCCQDTETTTAKLIKCGDKQGDCPGEGSRRGDCDVCLTISVIGDCYLFELSNGENFYVAEYDIITINEETTTIDYLPCDEDETE